MKRRSIRATYTPQVRVAGREIHITTVAIHGETRFEISGWLTPWCASSFVKDLRKALREIRAEQIRDLDSAVRNAEQEIIL